MRRPFFLACLFLATWCGAVGAQVPDRGSPLTRFGRIKPDDRVRVELAGPDRIEGRLAGSHRDTLFVATDSGEQRVPVDSIQRFWVRGRSTKQWATRGAIVGGVLGGLVNAWGAGASAEMTGDRFDGADAVLYLAVGGFIGGLVVGVPCALLGSILPRWDLRYAVHHGGTPGTSDR